jgi:hypothetical protein
MKGKLQCILSLTMTKEIFAKLHLCSFFSTALFYQNKIKDGFTFLMFGCFNSEISWTPLCWQIGEWLNHWPNADHKAWTVYSSIAATLRGTKHRMYRWGIKEGTRQATGRAAACSLMQYHLHRAHEDHWPHNIHIQVSKQNWRALTCPWWFLSPLSSILQFPSISSNLSAPGNKEQSGIVKLERKKVVTLKRIE